MHDEILDKKQEKLLPLLNKFNEEFGLVGGTAIALHLGHRRSIDFDMFSLKDFNSNEIRKVITQHHQIQQIFVDKPGELTILIDGVKLTFYKYPFPISFDYTFENVFKLPDITTLASMKAYALGRRAKWKDYVDLFFIFREVPFDVVVKKTEKLFKEEFNQKLFREQLCYFDDIDYSEKVEFLPNFQTSDEVIKKELVRIGLTK